MKKVNAWIEAMRLRTLPVSLSGVVAAASLAIADGKFNGCAISLCLLFALLAQIASNFANEYFDWHNGLDKPGREGPRRGVTEGDIAPRAMLAASVATLAVACLVGLTIAWIGGWWLIAAGVCIALGVFAYSAGPYPLSHHCLGEVAVICFFGLIPVTLTYYVSAHTITPEVAMSGLSAGLMGANVLLVNNIRDAATDREVGKHTIANTLGRRFALTLYLANGYAAVALMAPLWICLTKEIRVIAALWLGVHTMLWWAICHKHGRQLNPMLGMTAVAMAVYWLAFLLAVIFAV